MDGQQLDYLRQIARKVDDLLQRLKQGGTNGGTHAGARTEELALHLARVAGILDPQELPSAIVDTVVALTGAQRALIMMVEDGNKLRFKAGKNMSQPDVSASEFQPSRTVIKQVLHSGEPVLWDSSTQAELSMSQRGLNLQTAICAPLTYGLRLDGALKTHGCIYVDSIGVERALGQNELRITTSVADLAAVAMENAEIFQKADRERATTTRLRENVAKLYEVGRSIGSTLILEDLLVSIVDNVVSVAQAQRGFIMLLEGEDEKGKPAIRFKVGRDAHQRTLGEEQFAFSKTIARRTIEEKKAQVLTQALEGGGDAASLSIMQMKLQSIMCVPLIEKEHVIGLVYVDSQQENKEFTQSDAEILESLAGQAAVAIVNAKLYKETQDKERIRSELMVGAKIQSDLLPKVIPPVDGLEIYGFMKPAKEVGGDYYDFIPHEGTKSSITICIGDVSGKGVGAGLVMAMARSAIRSLVQREKVPRSTLPMLQGLNAHLCSDIPKGMFMTLNLLIWDSETKKLKYSPAGHEHILVYRAATKQVETTRAGGVACGVLKQASAMMQEKELALSKGDHVLLYTDGVTEAMDPEGKLYGLDRLEGIVIAHGHAAPLELLRAIEADVARHAQGAEQHDDITLIAIRRKG